MNLTSYICFSNLKIIKSLFSDFLNKLPTVTCKCTHTQRKKLHLLNHCHPPFRLGLPYLASKSPNLLASISIFYLYLCLYQLKSRGYIQDQLSLLISCFSFPVTFLKGFVSYSSCLYHLHLNSS